MVGDMTAAKFDYAKSADMAKRLITSFGQLTTVRKITQQSDGNGGVINANTDTVCNAVFLAYSIAESAQAHIEVGDQKVLIESVPAPSVGDLVLRGSEIWRIKSVKPLQPSGVNVLYQLQVGR